MGGLDVTSVSAASSAPALSPSSGTTDYALWSRPADGTGEPRPLASPDVGLGEARWIPPDAAALMVRSSAAPWASDSGIYRLSLDSVDGPMIPFAVAPGVSFSTPTISPDGRYAAYVSDESGRAEVYVRSFPAADEAVRVSLDGGREPSWSAEETELFYKGGGDGKGVDPAAGASAGSQAPHKPLNRPVPDMGTMAAHMSACFWGRRR